MKIVVIGCGEVGRAYTAAAHAAGHELVLVDPAPAPATVELAERLGLAIAASPGGRVADADRVWLCVSGDLVTRICAGLADELAPGPIVVDLTTASADDKRACAESSAERGVDYVDVVIMGAIATTGARTALLASGARARDVLADFAAFGAPVTAMPDSAPGDAAAVKLLRTILTKGLESLAVECFVAADTLDLRRALYAQLGDVDATGFVPFLEMLVTSHVQHAGRRLHEVRRARGQLAEIGCGSLALGGSEHRFEQTVDALGRRPPTHAPGDVDGAVRWLRESAE